MKKTGIASAIVRGAEQLDVMKNDIKIIDLVVGRNVHFKDFPYARSIVAGDQNTHPRFECEGGFWKLYPASNRWGLEYWSQSPGSASSALLYCTQGREPAKDDVKIVWGKLDDLVDGLRSRIPDFDRRIAAYVFAAPLLPDVT